MRHNIHKKVHLLLLGGTVSPVFSTSDASHHGTDIITCADVEGAIWTVERQWSESRRTRPGKASISIPHNEGEIVISIRGPYLLPEAFPDANSLNNPDITKFDEGCISIQYSNRDGQRSSTLSSTEFSRKILEAPGNPENVHRAIELLSLSIKSLVGHSYDDLISLFLGMHSEASCDLVHSNPVAVTVDSDPT